MQLSEAGTFTAQVIDVIWDQTAAGRRYISIRWETADGRHIDGALWVHSEGGWRVTERALCVLGWSPSEHDYDLGRLIPSGGGESPILGAWASLVVEEDGQWHRVQWVNALEGAARQSNMTDADARDFTVRLRQTLIGFGAGRKLRAAVPVRTPPPDTRPRTVRATTGPLNDDVPF